MQFLNTQDRTSATARDYYWTEDNVNFIRKKLNQVLKRYFKQTIVFSDINIRRIMQNVMEERYESVAEMNTRVIMILSNDFKNNQTEKRKHLKWAKVYKQSQKLCDPSGLFCKIGPGIASQTVCTNKKCKVGTGNLLFYPQN